MMQRSWEDLRREARKLESELDVRVAQYAKLCSGTFAPHAVIQRLWEGGPRSA